MSAAILLKRAIFLFHLLLLSLSTHSAHGASIFDDMGEFKAANRDKTVFIQVYDQQGGTLEASGTGVLLESGFVLTSLHLIVDLTETSFETDLPDKYVEGVVGANEGYPLRLTYIDQNRPQDLALFRFGPSVSADFDYACISANPLGDGDEIGILGFPGGLSLNNVKGAVSGFEASSILLDVTIAKGFSGAGVYDSDGRVVGIVQGGLIASGSASGFAAIIPISFAKNLLDYVTPAADSVCGKAIPDTAQDGIPADLFEQLENASSARQPELVQALTSAIGYLRSANLDDPDGDRLIADVISLYLNTRLFGDVAAETQRSLLAAISEIRPEIWMAPKVAILRQRSLQATGIYVYRQTNGQWDEASQSYLRELKTRIGYVVTPGAVLSIAPFRIGVSRCPFERCSITLDLVGTTDGGPAIAYPQYAFPDTKLGGYYDISADRTLNQYAIPIALESVPIPISFNLTCTDNGTGISSQIVVAGFEWDASDDANGNYSRWWPCQMGDVVIEVGFGVNSLSRRPGIPEGAVPVVGTLLPRPGQ